MIPRLLLLALLLSPFPAAAQAPKVRLDQAGDPLPPGAVARFGTLRLWHPGFIESLTFSPDGKTLISGVGEGTFVRVWDVATGKLRRQVGLHQGTGSAKYSVPPPPPPPPPPGRFERGGINIAMYREQRMLPRYVPVAFAPDGNAVLIGTNPCCQWWNLATGQTRPLWDIKDGRALSAVFAPDGKTLAVALFPGKVVLIDIATGKERGRLATPSDDLQADALAFSPDGKLLMVGFGAGNVWLWDCAKGKRLRWYLMGRNLHPGYNRVAAVALAPDAKAVAVACGNQVKLFETATDAELSGFTPIELEDETLARLRYGPNGKTLLGVTTRGRVFTWDAVTGKQLKVTGSREDGYHIAALDPAGGTVALAEANSMVLLDAQTGKPKVQVRSHHALLSAAFLDPLGRTAACADANGVLHFWDVSTGKEQRALTFPMLRGTNRTPVLSPDGRRLVTWAAEYKGLTLLDTTTGKEVWAAKLERNVVGRVAFSPDGASLAVVLGDGENLLEVWDATTGKRSYSLEMPMTMVNLQPCFAPDGRSLAAVGLNHRFAVVWELTTRTLRQAIPVSQPLALAFARDGQRLAVVAADDCPQLFRLGTEKPPQRLGPRGDFRTVVLSPDGRWLAASDSTGGIHVTELKGPRRYSWTAHEGGVSALAFSADGTKLLSSSMDGTALVWSMTALPRGGLTKTPALTAEECWQALGQPDGVRAALALAELARRGDETVVFLKARLAPVKAADPKQVATWLKELDSPQFGTRDRAMRGLEGLGDRAEVALRAALQKPLSAESKKRVLLLLERLDGPLTNPERVRAVRAVEVLEQVGSPAAVALLEALAAGAPGARPTREAQASLDRLRAP